MIHKSFKSGVRGSTRNGSNAMNYFLGENRDRENAKVLKGDPDLTLAIIKDNPHKYNYVSGCLSFTESDLPDDQKSEIMSSFENTIFKGMTAEQYNITWIEHRDKFNEETNERRLELNYIIPTQDLLSDKYHNPTQFGNGSILNRDLIKHWQEKTNHEMGLTSPDDLDRKRHFSFDHNLTPDRKILAEQVGFLIQSKVANGEITNREQVLNELKNNGYNVTRETKNNISILDPNGNKNIRLKGEVFKQEFDPRIVSAEFNDYLKNHEQEFKENKYKEHCDNYDRLLTKKEEFNQKRYGFKRDEAPTIKTVEQLNETLKTETFQEYKTATLERIRDEIKSNKQELKDNKKEEWKTQKRLDYFESRRNERIEKINDIKQGITTTQDKESRYFGLGAIFVSRQEKDNKELAIKNLTKEEKALDRDNQAVEREKAFNQKGYSIEDRKAIIDAEKALETHKKVEKDRDYYQERFYQNLKKEDEAQKAYYKENKKHNYKHNDKTDKLKQEYFRAKNFANADEKRLKEINNKLGSSEYKEKQKELENRLNSAIEKADNNVKQRSERTQEIKQENKENYSTIKEIEKGNKLKIEPNQLSDKFKDKNTRERYNDIDLRDKELSNKLQEKSKQLDAIKNDDFYQKNKGRLENHKQAEKQTETIKMLLNRISYNEKMKAYNEKKVKDYGDNLSRIREQYDKNNNSLFSAFKGKQQKKLKEEFEISKRNYEKYQKELDENNEILEKSNKELEEINKNIIHEKLSFSEKTRLEETKKKEEKIEKEYNDLRLKKIDSINEKREFEKENGITETDKKFIEQEREVSNLPSQSKEVRDYQEKQERLMQKQNEKDRGFEMEL